ncbi:Flp pilus assembly protein CpaB [Tenuibacillus multivorans]|uniref:Pilus assembly protein CpaB n=1 Tax=Tenuibacillus multivorans TaxID=237069 RepID=A0A1G9WGX5_9BACI|nr:SAF domain-containing protein [Tenuibacillus multivorans]GEL76462.1 hypothetical protein TMU01_06970 [Tenuibacillus multivorans]SDM83812.1 pilus assembly protein CpaB [Tenuibacillus multivorans]
MLESKRKAIIFFILAVIFAAVSGYLVLNKVQSINDNLGTMVTVYIANQDIDSRKIITPDAITTTEIPKKYERDEYITNISLFEGKVSLVPLKSGEIFTENMLKPASSVSEENNRLVSLIQSSRIAFDDKFTPNDRVDLFVSHTFEDEPVTEIFMQDIKVASIASENKGIQLEVPFNKADELIHMQHYADRLRIVKANVGTTAVPSEQTQLPEEGQQQITESQEEQPEEEINDETQNETSEEANDQNENGQE